MVVGRVAPGGGVVKDHAVAVQTIAGPNSPERAADRSATPLRSSTLRCQHHCLDGAGDAAHDPPDPHAPAPRTRATPHRTQAGAAGGTSGEPSVSSAKGPNW